MSWGAAGCSLLQAGGREVRGAATEKDKGRGSTEGQQGLERLDEHEARHGEDGLRKRREDAPEEAVHRRSPCGPIQGGDGTFVREGRAASPRKR